MVHPLGSHRPRLSDRFDKRIQVLVLVAAQERIAGSTCSASTSRNRRDEWIGAGIFETLEQVCPEAYDRVVGLGLGEVTVEGCIVEALCGGEVAGSPYGWPSGGPQLRSSRRGCRGCRQDPADHRPGREVAAAIVVDLALQLLAISARIAELDACITAT